MIEKIELKCFMKHEDLSITFTRGLNSIKARNEAGKSSILLGVAYALFGASVLPAPLDEVVTWGRKVTDLKVALDFSGYTFSRSKGGAEVTQGGKVICTGHNDVSDFAASLIGADAKAAMTLMFAPQNGLRGVLEDGPKATASMIENLSDMDLFDRIIEAAQERLPLGSTTLHDERLKSLESQLAQLPEAVAPEQPNLSSLDTEVERIKLDLDKATQEYQQVENEHVEEVMRRNNRDTLISDIAKLENQVTETGQKREALVVKRFEPDLEGMLSSLEQAQVEAEGYEKRVAAYKVFEGLQETDATLVTEQGLEGEIELLKTQVYNDRVKVMELESLVALQKSKLVSSSTCGFCGQDVSQFPEVQKKNEELLTSINTAEQERVSVQEALKVNKDSLEARQTLLKAHRSRKPDIESIRDYVVVDETRVPWLVSWKGSAPEYEPFDHTDEIKRIKAQIKERDETRIKIGTLTEVINDLHESIKIVYAKIEGLKLLPEGAFKILVAKFDALSVKRGQLSDEVQRLTEHRKTLVDQYEEALREYKARVERHNALKLDIAAVRAEISEIGFNNALLKKVRAVRPVVGNKLWNLVLTSVSTLFSQIRGTKSIVTRDGSRFLVNGQSASTLSGSTKDALGAALRVALTKTFIPNCRTLVLDEPMAAMDSERAQSLLAFIAGCGFDQVILVTHDPVSELFADNLIQLA